MQTEQPKLIDIADRVLMQFDDHEETYEYFPFIRYGFRQEEIEDGRHTRTIIDVLKILEDKLGYIEESRKTSWYSLTEKGREVKAAGGHFAYLQKIADKKAAEVDRQRLNDEKLKYDVKNSKRIFKTYWWTFAFAVIGLAISLTLGILKLLEVFQHKPVK